MGRKKKAMDRPIISHKHRLAVVSRKIMHTVGRKNIEEKFSIWQQYLRRKMEKKSDKQNGEKMGEKMGKKIQRKIKKKIWKKIQKKNHKKMFQLNCRKKLKNGPHKEIRPLNVRKAPYLEGLLFSNIWL